ncbi:cupin domain-containing protein [Entomobacter blattae]|uniref:dTDP-4-dehydrorhamnose 3,5-epimerase n=1 Tax=Entomobacter blattae TaxID=2762277 RepID=A0A7H1NPV7_9PROT|nr:dTDP-4-dehydrorhamnose 3,5-epimerase [Entomobacter blattae]QNT77817.1 hypothetical protein JGUZn3_05720 [Entomobacter blattae]
MMLPFVTPLKRIPTPKGDVLHGIKATDSGFEGFGEAYFTHIHHQETKGWKRHNRMTLNLICPYGKIKVTVRDEKNIVLEALLSPDQAETYQRLTVPPGYFVAFTGLAKGDSLLLNVASIMHDKNEADTVPLNYFDP